MLAESNTICQEWNNLQRKLDTFYVLPLIVNLFLTAAIRTWTAKHLLLQQKFQQSGIKLQGNDNIGFW